MFLIRRFSRGSEKEHVLGKFEWMDNLQFYILFYSISVMPGVIQDNGRVILKGCVQ